MRDPVKLLIVDRAPPLPPAPEPPPIPPPSSAGLVRTAGKTLTDDHGAFFGLGWTDFQAVRNRQFDPAFDERRGAGMAELGYNYRRILGTVGWTDLEIGPQHAWYWDALASAIWTPFVNYGVRTLLTIGADLRTVFPNASQDTVRAFYQQIGERLRPIATAIIALEGCNEPWNGNWPFDVAFLRTCVEQAAILAGVHVYGPGAPTSDGGEVSQPYRGLPVWYVHLDRKHDTWEGLYRIPRQARGPQEQGQRWVNGEPAGPESSDGDITDPQILFDIQCSALMCDAVATCYHSRAGTGNRGKRDLLASPGVREAALVKKYLPADIAQWQFRNHSNPPAPHPFRFIDPVGDPMGTIDGSKRGVVRAFSKVASDGRFIVQALGVPGGATWEAVNRCRVRVIDPLLGIERVVTLDAGNKLELEPAPRGADERPAYKSYLIVST